MSAALTQLRLILKEHVTVCYGDLAQASMGDGVMYDFGKSICLCLFAEYIYNTCHNECSFQ